MCAQYVKFTRSPDLYSANVNYSTSLMNNPSSFLLVQFTHGSRKTNQGWSPRVHLPILPKPVALTHPCIIQIWVKPGMYYHYQFTHKASACTVLCSLSALSYPGMHWYCYLRCSSPESKLRRYYWYPWISRSSIFIQIWDKPGTPSSHTRSISILECIILLFHGPPSKLRRYLIWRPCQSRSSTCDC